ncbi:MAG: adenosylmethionine decarboxylase [Gammaproteobacteria bacterium]|nr:adenosylmethionine decarboxylase [Gammaproteobacteria bacterium]
MRSLGHQIVAEFYRCDTTRLNDVNFVGDAMIAAAEKAGATIVTQTFHHFSPHGVSGAVIIAESHLAIHTWPEYGYAAVDLFTCGDTVSSAAALESLREAFAAEQVSTMELHRGQVDMMDSDGPVTHKPGIHRREGLPSDHRRPERSEGPAIAARG